MDNELVISTKREGEKMETLGGTDLRMEQEGHRERARSRTKAYFCTIRFAAIRSFLLQQSSLLCLSVKTIPHDFGCLTGMLMQWFDITTLSC